MDYLFLAWNQIAQPDRGITLLSQCEKAGNVPTAVSLTIRSELRAFHGFFSGEIESVEGALEDVSAARLMLGATKFTLQTELAALIAAITLRRERGSDFQQYDRRAKEVADRLLKYNDYAWGRMVRSWYFLAIKDDAAAEVELREICRISPNPYLHASLAYLLFQTGDSSKSREAIDIVVRFGPSIYQDVCSLILADAVLQNKEIATEDNSERGLRTSSYESAPSLYGLLARRELGEARSRAGQMLRLRRTSTPAPGTWAYLEVETLKYIAGDSTDERFAVVANENREWSCEVHLVLGLMHIAEGHYDTAREILKTATKHDLFYLWPYQQSLGLLRRLDDPDWLASRAQSFELDN